jgi:hypothetical protein
LLLLLLVCARVFVFVFVFARVCATDDVAVCNVGVLRLCAFNFMGSRDRVHQDPSFEQRWRLAYQHFGLRFGYRVGGIGSFGFGYQARLNPPVLVAILSCGRQ